ncbi:MAG TPA: hypothetical protein VHE78_00640 [Gemmatimonadaceae bacterium]|nr:hypothetical protein [Gemmatimonadaceae bacterium]
MISVGHRTTHRAWAKAACGLLATSFAAPASAQYTNLWGEVDLTASLGKLAITVPVVARTDSRFAGAQLFGGGIIADFALP